MLDSLRRWESEAPPRARRFHDVRRELESQIAATLAAWWPWLGDQILARYKDRTRNVEQIASSLMRLIEDAERLEAEVRALSGDLRSLDTELSSYIEGRCRDWLGSLGQLGTTCDRAAELAAEVRVLAKTESAVRLHGEAVRELRESARIVDALGENRAMSLMVRLPEFKKRLYKQGATNDWLEELRVAIAPLRVIADRVVDPPEELRSLSQALTDARSWSRRLGGEAQPEVERLEERNFRAADFEVEEVQELVAEANALRARLVLRANEMRGEKLSLFRAQMSDLRQACGPQPALDALFDALETARADHPPLFRDWLAQAERFLESFNAIAHTHIGVIEARLLETIDALGRKLDVLDERPLSRQVRREVTVVRQDLSALPAAISSEEMLLQLRRTAVFEESIARLSRLADEELRDIDDQQQALSERNSALRYAVQRAKRLRIEVIDFDPRITALSQRSAGISLEQRRDEVEQLSHELGAVEAHFISQCRDAVTSEGNSIRRLAKVLRQVGITPPFSDADVLAEGTTLEAATIAILEARRRHDLSLHRARNAWKELEGRRELVQTEMAKLRLDDLGPADRQTAATLLQDLESAGWRDVRGLPERIESLAVLLDGCTQLFERLLQEQRGARERQADLQKRLRRFIEEQLGRFCPELTDRVSALVYGIPENPRHWSAVHHQLDIAGELLDRIEVHAGRLAAEELDRAVDALRQKVRPSAAPSFRATATELLTELDAKGHDILAPAALRLRIVSASERRV
ncbi:MAG TPA: molecular chaperone TorD family protein [Thermoanaerobaculia bacterium]|nr:molecular chaperone TorD family protein [Thermoanaerobaculia bacterium]